MEILAIRALLDTTNIPVVKAIMAWEAARNSASSVLSKTYESLEAVYVYTISESANEV